MSMPLFFTSSKVASTDVLPGAGQPQAMSSSGVAAGVLAGATGAGTATRAALAAVTADEAAGVDALAALAAGVTDDAASDGNATGRVTTVSDTGGDTRSTWPVSMTFGLSSAFQRTMSRQFWPCSSAMRMRVSPCRTV